MPRFWYVFAGPQTAAGYSTLGNYIYYKPAGDPSCSAGNNICTVYALGDPNLVHRTNSNPISVSPANTTISTAKANGADQYIGTRLYLKVRTDA